MTRLCPAEHLGGLAWPPRPAAACQHLGLPGAGRGAGGWQGGWQGAVEPAQVADVQPGHLAGAACVAASRSHTQGQREGWTEAGQGPRAEGVPASRQGPASRRCQAHQDGEEAALPPPSRSRSRAFLPPTPCGAWSLRCLVQQEEGGRSRPVSCHWHSVGSDTIWHVCPLSRAVPACVLCPLWSLKQKRAPFACHAGISRPSSRRGPGPVLLVLHRHLNVRREGRGRGGGEGVTGSGFRRSS